MFNYVIDTRTGVKRRLMPGETMRDGEAMYAPMEVMHRPATRKLSDAAVATYIRDSATGSKPDAVPAGFFKDAYGRLLPTGTGPERDRAEGLRIATEAMLADAWKGDDAQPDAGCTRDQYIADISNAWRGEPGSAAGSDE